MKAQDRPTYLALLWTVVLLAPVAWTMALGTMFPMTDWVCDGGPRSVFFAAGGICLALALIGGAVGWMRLAQTIEERSRFMLQLGIGSSALVALVIAMYIVPLFLLSSCPT